jgi:hypothetical protein
MVLLRVIKDLSRSNCCLPDSLRPEVKSRIATTDSSGDRCFMWFILEVGVVASPYIIRYKKHFINTNIFSIIFNKSENKKPCNISLYHRVINFKGLFNSPVF